MFWSYRSHPMKSKLPLTLLSISLLCLSLNKLEAAQFLIDFGVSATTTNVDGNGNHWNNLTAVTSGDNTDAVNVRSGSFALKATTGVTTVQSFSYQFATGVRDFTGMNGYSNVVSSSLTNLGLMNVSTAINDGIWTARDATMTFTGLDSDHLYSFQIYGYRSTSNRTTIYQMQGDGDLLSQESDAASFAANGGKTLSFLNLRPDSNGEITLTLTPGTGGYAYLGALSMTSTVPEPGHGLLMSLATLALVSRRSRKSFFC